MGILIITNQANMMYLFFILPPSQALLTYGPDCYSFRCNSSLIRDFNTTCVNVDHENKEITIRGCDAYYNLSCNYLSEYSNPENEWLNQTCIDNSQLTQTIDCNARGVGVTGDSCCVDNNCVSGNCVDGSCQGLLLNSPCVYSKECDVGHYCSSDDICVSVGAINSTCESDHECPTGTGCNLGYCIELFSLPPGSLTDAAKFCVNNFQLESYCDVLTVKLQASNFTLYSPFMCVSEDICEYYSFNGSLYDSFECKCAGIKGLPEGFCGEHLAYVGGVLDDVWKVLKYSTSKCSGDKAHTDDALTLIRCSSITVKEFIYFYNIYNQAVYWNIYVTGSLDECANSLLLWDPYYSARDFSDSHLTFLPFFLLLSTIIL